MKNHVKIQVFGSGCPSCKRLFETTKEAVTTMKLNTEVEYIIDVQKLIDLGVMQSPVLAVNGQPIMAGSVPDRDTIVEILSKHLAE